MLYVVKDLKVPKMSAEWKKPAHSESDDRSSFPFSCQTLWKQLLKSVSIDRPGGYSMKLASKGWAITGEPGLYKQLL